MAPSCDWYQVLRLPCTANQTQIRSAFKTMALLTHPDKRILCSSSDASQEMPSFNLVREAAAILLDPLQRAIFDGQRVNVLVRTEGRISSTYGDEDVVISIDDDIQTTAWGVVECRCGGEYRVLLASFPRGGRYISECDTCSLVVEISVSDDKVASVCNGYR